MNVVVSPLVGHDVLLMTMIAVTRGGKKFRRDRPLGGRR